jgi:hypothetical protein
MAEGEHPKNRDDISKFLIHLTRDYENSMAVDNLVNILYYKVIEARNPHCLFIHKLTGFTPVLRQKFNSVCLTETPLNQIRNLTIDVSTRKVKLKPYGLVFWKDELLRSGANPAVYINASGTGLRDYLLDQFNIQFKDIYRWRDLREANDYSKEIIQYFSLINIVNEKHDFMWEREWRHPGNLSFSYNELVAIIAEDPKIFERSCRARFNKAEFEKLLGIPMISPYWNYEEIVEELSFTLWKIRNK